MRYPISFQMSESESEKANAFVEGHYHRDMGHTAIGGHISYHVTPTSIGVTWVVACSRCGAQTNVTDYDQW